MAETAQIILAVGLALALILFALKGNLSVLLSRSEPRVKAGDHRPILKEQWLLAIVGVSALSGLLNLLTRLL